MKHSKKEEVSGTPRRGLKNDKCYSSVLVGGMYSIECDRVIITRGCEVTTGSVCSDWMFSTYDVHPLYSACLLLRMFL